MKARQLFALFVLITSCACVQERPRVWTFEELLRPPTAAELRRVDEDWAAKRLVVGEISLVDSTTVPVGAEQFEARVYTYELNGSQRCGAVILPRGAGPKSLAGLVDIGDVRWDYPDRNLTNGPYVARILGDRAREFALVVPCARGMALRIGDVRVQAEGDRRDAWEGCAEDSISFLTAALSVTPAIDPQRLGSYGYSRGGGVALIVGEWDDRIKAVVAFAGPTDWLTAMGRPGQNWPQRLKEAARDPALEPDTRESQFLDWFVRDRDTMSLADLRRRLVGASPLYFTDRLPAFQIHHGMSDGPVPVRNAMAIRERVGTQDESRRVITYEGAEHLLDGTAAFTIARAFLIERLLLPGPIEAR